MGALWSMAGLLLAGRTAFAQGVGAELRLDIRSRLRPPSPYQRIDTLHTSELGLHAAPDGRTTIDVTVQRRFFETRITQFRVEREVSPHLSVAAGALRLPFGIHDPAETYRSGLIDYPMPRVDYGDYGVDRSAPGASARWEQGPWQALVGGFRGDGVNVWNDVNTVGGTVVRLQRHLPPTAIVGASRWSGHQSEYGGGRAPVALSGIDLRLAARYVVVRAEALWGRVDRQRHRGAYVDTFYRLPGLPDWTVAARGEWFHPDDRFRSARQATLGVRWTANPDWTLTLNWRGNDVGGKYPNTWVPQSGRRGDLILQVYRTFAIRGR